MDIVELCGRLFAKAVTVVATVVVSNNGIDALLNYLSAPTPETAAVLKALSIVAAYGVWQQVVIPFVDGALKPPVKGTAGLLRPSLADYTALV